MPPVRCSLGWGRRIFSERKRSVRTAHVLERLHALGFASLTEDPEHYGPALALGDGEVTLLELANAYATLARGGVLRPVRLVDDVVLDGERRVFDPPASVRVLDE